jgi:amino-acid N-acetyltransferase
MTHARKATMADIPAMVKLISHYAAEGIMLPRSEFELAEGIRDFMVVEEEGRLLGCGALQFYSSTFGEVRSLAVQPEGRTRGAGRAIVEALNEEAKAFDLEALFAFTYVPGFFRRLGYEEIDRNELPLKAWKDCLRCPKFTACDEIAVLKRLRPGRTVRAAVPADLVVLDGNRWVRPVPAGH